MICLTIAHGARDFHSGKRITPELLRDPELKIEDHHVVPSGFLKQLDPPVDREDSVLNKCLIAAKTNRLISDSDPSDYLSAVASEIGDDLLGEILESHFLPSGGGSPLIDKPFDLEAFLEAREQLLLPAVAAATGAEISAGRIEDVYLRPDQPFSSDLALRRLIRGLSGKVLWYEQHMDRKALEILVDELDSEAVLTLRLLSGPANLSPKTQRAFERFKKELGALGLVVEWRVLPVELARTMHARVIFDDTATYELPPLGSILKGTIDSIRESKLPRKPFDSAWESNEGTPLLELQLQGAPA